VIGDNVRATLAEFIRTRHADWKSQEFICFDLGAFRKEYVKHVLEDEFGELTALDHKVIESLQQHELLSENIEKQFERKLSFGDSNRTAREAWSTAPSFVARGSELD
jgi:hypothetical protein